MQISEGNVGSASHLVIACDEMPMRRAQLAAFLSQWAIVERVELVTVDMPDTLHPLDLQARCRMVIFSIGSVVLDRSPIPSLIQRLGEQHQTVAVVVMADAGSAHDAAAAFQAGAKGYIPASIEPDVALRALSFILNGGHFFPPSALQATRPASRRGNDGGGTSGNDPFGKSHYMSNGDMDPQRHLTP